MFKAWLVSASALVFLHGCASPRLDSSETYAETVSAHWLTDSPQMAPYAVEYYAPNQAFLDYQGEVTVQVTSPVVDRELLKPRLTSGDRIRLYLPTGLWDAGFYNSNDEVYNSVYEIGQEGELQLPFLKPVPVQGLTVGQLKKAVDSAFEVAKIFTPGMAQTTVQVQDWAPANVYVQGAVFNAGRKTINPRNPENQLTQFNTVGESVSNARRLSSAIQAAGGVRPDANLGDVQVLRGNDTIQLNLIGLVEGYPAEDIMLMEGDRVRIPSIGRPQDYLVKPSPVTPPGIRIFISNLTVPALNNASSAVGPHATSVPYGSRLHHAVTSGNCAGGTLSTNSRRYVVLVTTDQIRQVPITVERTIAQVLRSPNNLGVNPYLMPNDSIVCYDSDVSNYRDIARSIVDVLSPLSVLP